MKLCILLFILILTGCTTFKVTYSDGTIIESSGAVLVSRSDDFEVSHQWLGKDNVLHEVKVHRGTTENADKQAEAFAKLADTIQALATMPK